jgi:Endoribonuclease L-PSP
MPQHYVRPDGMPPVNGYSHAVAFTGRMIAVSGQVPLDAAGRLVGPGDPLAQARQDPPRFRKGNSMIPENQLSAAQRSASCRCW